MRGRAYFLLLAAALWTGAPAWAELALPLPPGAEQQSSPQTFHQTRHPRPDFLIAQPSDAALVGMMDRRVMAELSRFNSLADLFVGIAEGNALQD